MNLKLFILLVSSSLIVAASAIFFNAIALAHSQTQGHHEAILPGTRLGARAFPAPLSSLLAQPVLPSHRGCSCPNCLTLSMTEAVAQLALGKGRSLQSFLPILNLKNE